jgi:hypothetical protein
MDYNQEYVKYLRACRRRAFREAALAFAIFAVAFVATAMYALSLIKKPDEADITEAIRVEYHTEAERKTKCESPVLMAAWYEREPSAGFINKIMGIEG